jgi:hypothetical protein
LEKGDRFPLWPKGKRADGGLSFFISLQLYLTDVKAAIYTVTGLAEGQIIIKELARAAKLKTRSLPSSQGRT